MIATPQTLLARLVDLGLDCTTHAHPPVFTVEESKAQRGDLPGGHCKNLFLKDKKGALWLVVATEDRAIDLKALRRAIGSAALSFGKPEVLLQVLGVTPGSVSPFALINDTGGRVTVVLDKAMMAERLLNYHPLDNTLTTAIPPEGLEIFLRATGHNPMIVEL